MSSGSIIDMGKWGKAGIGRQKVILLKVLYTSNGAVLCFNIKLILCLFCTERCNITV